MHEDASLAAGPCFFKFLFFKLFSPQFVFFLRPKKLISEPLPAHHSDLPIPQRNRTERQRAERGGRGFYVEAMDAVLVNPELIAPHVPYAPTSSAAKDASRHALVEDDGNTGDAEKAKK